MLDELPLVIFTIAAQMSAGSFIVLGLIHLLGHKVPQETMDKVTDPALFAIGPLLLLGLAASTFHLGSPLRALNSVLHLGGSWLSAEIVTGSAFLVLGAAFAFVQWRKLFWHGFRQLLAGVTALVCAFLVFAISQVYSLRTVPAWATFHTPVRFFITALLLGGVAVGAALVIAARRAEKDAPDPAASRLLTNCVRGIALGAIVALGLKFAGMARQERNERAYELLRLVNLQDFAKAHPYELSGGMRQRVGLARALATNPALIVADEPISALDVSIQAQVVNLMADLKEKLGLTYVMVSHDLSMVRYISDRVAVMYLGRIVEIGSRDAVFDTPRHPYTQALLSAIPTPDPKRERQRKRIVLQGDVPNPANPPSGCRFHPRCARATAQCREADPVLQAVATDGGHQVACHHAREGGE